MIECNNNDICSNGISAKKMTSITLKKKPAQILAEKCNESPRKESSIVIKVSLRVAKLPADGRIKEERDSSRQRLMWSRVDLASNSRLVSASDDSTIKIWSLNSELDAGAACVHTLKGHLRSVRCILVRPETEQLISGSEDNSIKIWSLKTGKCVRTLHGHVNLVRFLVLRPETDELISSSGPIIKMWCLVNININIIKDLDFVILGERSSF